MRTPRLLLLFLSALLCGLSLSARETQPLNDGWTFTRGFIRPGVVAGKALGHGTAGEPVTLPHTWNAADFMTETDYYRGYGHYTRTLTVPEQRDGKRYFLRFEGAGITTTLQVNSTYVGEHKGAYTAFVFEITDYLQSGENTLTVICSNAPGFEVAPIGGDFNQYGGLYRPVWLETTEDACISPLWYGSSGVLVSQRQVSRERAELQAEIHLSAAKGCEVRFEVQDAGGRTVAQAAPLSPVCDDTVFLRTAIDHPHLWDARTDPYLYSAVTILLRDGKELDRVSVPLGIRSFHVDPQRGFFLNGNHLKLRGVSRHQDWAAIATALLDEHHLADYELMDEMGVNALRLAHYPQSRTVLDEADRRGYVIWEEIPFVGTWVPNPAFDANLEQQLREMIAQHFNHPSICFWGLYNEIQAGTDAIVSRLNTVAHQLDPGRLTTCAVYIDSSNELIPDVMAFNKYFGWYYGKIDDLGPFYDDWHAAHPEVCLGLSEYGAGAGFQHVGQFDENAFTVMDSMGRNHPMERQTAIHRAQWPMIAERDWIWGSFVWNMFDFGASGRFEGDAPNQNDKGLVSHDRQRRKDAFYYYKANWNKAAKTVHLCSADYTQRKESVTDVIVFTTAPEARLYLNGKLVSRQKTDAYATTEWRDVQLQPGPNTVLVRTPQGNVSAVWTVQ